MIISSSLRQQICDAGIDKRLTLEESISQKLPLCQTFRDNIPATGSLFLARCFLPPASSQQLQFDTKAPSQLPIREDLGQEERGGPQYNPPLYYYTTFF